MAQKFFAELARQTTKRLNSSTLIVGESSQGLVKIAFNNSGKPVHMKIDPSLLTKEKRIQVQEHIVFAFNEGMTKYVNVHANPELSGVPLKVLKGKKVKPTTGEPSKPE
eukprot:TRINITY_DN1030_c0_g1_i1.p1 TRINITY_DN1030_c0_g1~~TRINITY_DN1030_c0_g1_i1.p1  ORF type:complete len:109 (-),score=20.42 TRINITY_DN1030_c0_g1_i1:171-497(-)